MHPELQDNISRRGRAEFQYIRQPNRAGDKAAKAQGFPLRRLWHAGLSPEILLVRDASRPGWRRGLEATIGVVCDAVTAAELPKACHPLIFTLLSKQAFNHLRQIETALTNTPA